jgi:hypothetical protein
MATGDATPERWLPVRGAEGWYEVSDQGRVRSIDRAAIHSDGRLYSYRGKALRPAATGAAGHLCVVISINGKTKTRLVHQLVLEAFTEGRPKGQHARHGPGGVTDNRLVNLCWGTPVENMEDKKRDGTLRRGDSHQGAKLTEAVVLECRHRYAAGESQTALAAEYGVSVGCMSCAVRGLTWSWLPDAVPVRPGYGGKLAPEIAEEARRRYAAGESRIVLAAEYGVARGTLWRTVHAKA